MAGTIRVVSWNMGHQTDAWRTLSDTEADIALLQEAVAPPPDVASHVEVDPGPWLTEASPTPRTFRAAIARLSDRVRMHPRPTAALARSSDDEVPVRVSRLGTVALADIEVLGTGELITVASVYGLWERPSPTVKSSWIYADASVHRVLSDLSALIGHEALGPLLVAGDLNILHGYGERGSDYWKRRYSTVFDRAEALGLVYMGPAAPGGGQRASPHPAELPLESLDVPTFRTRPSDPTSAQRQLDFVFASRVLTSRMTVRALNSKPDWGTGDHCRISIELAACQGAGGAA